MVFEFIYASKKKKRGRSINIVSRDLMMEMKCGVVCHENNEKFKKSNSCVDHSIGKEISDIDDA